MFRNFWFIPNSTAVCIELRRGFLQFKFSRTNWMFIFRIFPPKLDRFHHTEIYVIRYNFVILAYQTKRDLPITQSLQIDRQSPAPLLWRIYTNMLWVPAIYSPFSEKWDISILTSKNFLQRRRICKWHANANPPPPPFCYNSGPKESVDLT